VLRSLPQVSQVSAVFRLLAASRCRFESGHVLQDNERLCAGVSDDSRTSDASATEESHSATTQHDPWKNDCWSQYCLYYFVQCVLMGRTHKLEMANFILPFYLTWVAYIVWCHFGFMSLTFCRCWHSKRRIFFRGNQKNSALKIATFCVIRVSWWKWFVSEMTYIDWYSRFDSFGCLMLMHISLLSLSARDLCCWFKRQVVIGGNESDVTVVTDGELCQEVIVDQRSGSCCGSRRCSC